MADSGAGGSLARKLAEVVLGSAHPPSRDEHSDDTEVAINSLRAAAEQRQTKRLGRSKEGKEGQHVTRTLSGTDLDTLSERGARTRASPPPTTRTPLMSLQ